MKTRPITYSVKSRWTNDQSTYKVKSIVEWTTTGGKNNKEAIEILDKRNRDHFRYQAHKNHTKEKERKEQYSTFRT